jgi:DivIVA domain-containing protein
MVDGFRIVMRGYDRAQVDQLVARAEEAANSDDAALRAAAKRALEDPQLLVVLRGYDRRGVERALDELKARLG